MIQFASANPRSPSPVSLFSPLGPPTPLSSLPSATLEHIFGSESSLPVCSRQRWLAREDIPGACQPVRLLTAIVCSPLSPPTPSTPSRPSREFSSYTPFYRADAWGCNFYFRSRSNAFRRLPKSKSRRRESARTWRATTRVTSAREDSFSPRFSRIDISTYYRKLSLYLASGSDSL